MNENLFIFSFIVFLTFIISTTCAFEGQSDYIPIIGILSLPNSECGSKEADVTSCFSSFYTKWLESAGARVAVIPYNLEKVELRVLLESLNGVLFTGGDIDMYKPHPYFTTAKFIYDYVKDVNNKGKYYPLWGTCQGFQLMVNFEIGDSTIYHCNFNSRNISLPLEFTSEAMKGKMFGADSVPESIYKIYQSDNITANIHYCGFYPEDWDKSEKLKSFYRVISTNKDIDGKPFISTIEALNYPMYGAQWHPERPQFEFDPTLRISHSIKSMIGMQYISNFFVSECRKNTNQMAIFIQKEFLIYNHVPQGNTTTGKQSYFFKY